MCVFLFVIINCGMCGAKFKTVTRSSSLQHTIHKIEELNFLYFSHLWELSEILRRNTKIRPISSNSFELNPNFGKDNILHMVVPMFVSDERLQVLNALKSNKLF